MGVYGSEQGGVGGSRKEREGEDMGEQRRGEWEGEAEQIGRRRGGKGRRKGIRGGEAWGRENGEEAKAGIDLSLSS